MSTEGSSAESCSSSSFPVSQSVNLEQTQMTSRLKALTKLGDSAKRRVRNRGRTVWCLQDVLGAHLVLVDAKVEEVLDELRLLGLAQSCTAE
jgi:hypothetical protein